MAIVPREQRKKVYKFANQPQAMRLLKKYDFDAGFIQGRLLWDSDDRNHHAHIMLTMRELIRILRAFHARRA